MVQDNDTHENPKDPRRRTLLEYATGAVLVGGAGAATWPIIMQMAPDRSIATPLRIDISRLKVGEIRIIILKKAPFILLHRTPEDIAASRLWNRTQAIDGLARNANLSEDAPATDENRAFGSQGQFIFMSLNCTHLGCVLISQREKLTAEPTQFSNYVCPCHASRFDAAGRVLTAPARTNLPIPRFSVENDTAILIGSEVGNV